jgi:hypothetical protein
MPVESLQRCDARKPNRPAVFSCQCQAFRRGGYGRHIMIGFWDGLSEMRNRVAKGGELGAI